MRTEITTLIHHSVQANVIQAPPQGMAQAKTVMLTSVLKPIEKVPRKSDCAGCKSIAGKIEGKKA